MDGQLCPFCRKTCEWIATISEWQFYCPDCSVRFAWERSDGIDFIDLKNHKEYHVYWLPNVTD